MIEVMHAVNENLSCAFFFGDFISIFLIKIELLLYFDLKLCYNIKGFIYLWKVGSS